MFQSSKKLDHLPFLTDPKMYVQVVYRCETLAAYLDVYKLREFPSYSFHEL